MERYSESQAMEGASADPPPEWATPTGEMGLEEPMWQLGLAGSGSESQSYPERPGEPDCIYYLRTGFCGFGSRCRFNHPRDRSWVVRATRASGGEYPERAGQPVCQHYIRTGMCKFGTSCKYHHPRPGGGPLTPAALNIYGYPLRPGENECSYYVRTGQCKFGVSCKFHHPQPASAQVPLPTPHLAAPVAIPAPPIYTTVHSAPPQSSQQYGAAAANWPVARPGLLPGSYISSTYSPFFLPPGMVPVQGWSPYTAPISPATSSSTQPTFGAGAVYGITQLSPSAPAYTGPYISLAGSSGPSGSSQREHGFPERPEQPECQYYMRTGDCKFGSSCKYHHPPERTAANINFALGPMGLPLRPGAPVCSHYAQNGICKFGPSCKFDHPIGTLSYSPSASSLADMPVAPYPIGSSTGTLAPSSSSSDLRPELISGSSKDAVSNRKSSMGTSCGSSSSMFPKSGSVPHSVVGHSAESSSPQGSDVDIHGGEVHTSS